MAFSSDFEGSIGTRGDRDNLTTPAETDNAELLDVGIGGLDGFDETGDLGCGGWGCAGGAEEVTEGCLLFRVGWWVPVMRFVSLEIFCL